MENIIQLFNGVLKSEAGSAAVQICFASKFSVFIKFEDQGVSHGEGLYSSLRIETGPRSFETGGCRLIAERDKPDCDGRLVFTDDLYNFELLFKKGDFVNLGRLSKDLVVMLNQKDKVRDDFKRYMSVFIYDLKVYKQYFDELDILIGAEPDCVKDSALLAILAVEGKKFMNFFDGYLDEMDKLIGGFSREEHEIHGFYLRKQVWDIIMCSEFMKRTNLKPRGYIGDSETMRMIYENGYRGESIFGKILYKYSLDHPGAEAVRNRRIMVPQLLRRIKNSYSGRKDRQFKFMSVACGPAYELNDIYLNEDDVSFFNCTLLDQDDEAIGEALENIQNIEKRTGAAVNVAFIRDSVRTMIRSRDLSDKWGRFDYIYSMGLFDYLTPPVAKAVIEKIYSLLEPGGTLLVGNYHYNNRSRFFMEYWHDWVLYYRTEEEFKSLLKDTDAEDVSIIFEDTGSQMFLTAVKPL